MKKIALLFVVLLASCSDNNNNNGIQGTVNRLEKEITITVTTVKNESELSKLYSDLTGVPKSRVPEQYGFAQWNERKIGEPESYNCQIYIIEPKRADDQQILTLGHEMAHCLWGSYHQ